MIEGLFIIGIANLVQRHIARHTECLVKCSSYFEVKSLSRIGPFC
jgi:hypothetical protein